jgi:UDP-2-acetamido-3-amino-2,3-dideoxy-glucuronate N-acetyltransferase
MGKEVKVAVIGSGYWGKNLVRNYYELGRLGLICDNSQAVLDRFSEQYPGVDTCLALTDVLSRGDVGAVVVATPAETHYAMAREALDAGKHVYVEKPLVLDEAHGRELIDIAEKRGLTLMVGHLLHYHPAFVRLGEMVRSGELGRINYIYSNRLNLGKIRREENILWSFAPHDISMILSLAGERPSKVTATGGSYLHKKIADVTTTHLEFPSGLKAHIFVSWLHPFKEQKLVVVGEKKMAVFDDTRPWPEKLALYPHSIEWQGNMPVPVKAEPEYADMAEAEPLKLECLHFLECAEKGRNPLTDGAEGLRVLEILNAAQRSMDSARAVDMAAAPAEYFVHESSYLDDGVVVGRGTKIWHFCHLMSGARIGENCNIGQNVVVGPDVTVGDGCKIQNNVSVYKGVTLEDRVFCGPSMVFTNVYNPRAGIARMDEAKPTLVRTGATLGANCTIVCGNDVGRYAFVAAGAVVTADVADHSLVAGAPAVHKAWMCECGVRLNEDLTCPDCGLAFAEAATGLARKS